MSTRLCITLSFISPSYFAEIEQAAFSPGRLVDGWALSADPVLQSRSFSYPGRLAQLYQVGVLRLIANQRCAPLQARCKLYGMYYSICPQIEYSRLRIIFTNVANTCKIIRS